MKINKQDANGVKPLLAVGELGYDNYPSGGDIGRIYVGTGSSNIALAKKSEVDTKVVANANITAGTATKVTYDTKGLVTAGTALSAGDIPVLDAGKITTGTLPVVIGGTGATTSTGTGSVVLSSSPVLVTPTIGVATGTSFNSITGLSSTTPVIAGTAAIGTGTTTARADHVHPAQTTISGNAGTATALATSRNITVGNTAKSFNGSADVAWSVAEIGAQPVDADLTAISALAGTSGLLKKTAADTWTLDTSAYVTSSGVTSVTGTAPIVSSGGNTPAISITAATTSASGSMSAADKTKLDSIAAGAQVNVATDLSLGAATATTLPLNSSTGTDVTLPAVTTTTAGLMGSADKVRLDGIATNANNYTLPTATSTAIGGVKVSATAQTVAGNAVTATASRSYAVQLDASGNALVNVPWVDTNTVYTHPTSGVTAGSYSKVTVDANGHVTAGLTPTMEDIPDATFKRSVKVATTANITLSAPQTIDGIAVVAGDRVLVKDQTTAFQNGIYVVAAGAWTRALDADTASKIASALVAVDSGTVNGGKLFDNDFKTTDTLGTTAMLWAFNLDSGSLSSTTPLVAGTAAIGTVTTVARADHVHPAQTTITGNAGTATTLQTARTISGVSFNGSANIEIEDRIGTAIASAATTTIGTRGLGDYIHITGVATITSLGTAAAAGIRRTLIFDGALTLTHNATSLICPGAANIVTVSGTVIEVVSETTANWRVVSITHPSLGMLELGYLDGVTSAIQSQINLKAPLNNPVFTSAISTKDVNYKSTPISVTSWSYVTTTITLNVASHTFLAGDYIEVLGLTSTTYPANGIHLVTSVTSTTIVFTLGATPTGTAGVSSATVKGITTLNGKIISEDIGINQSWQLVTRLSDTNYSNTSNRMIKMVVYGFSSFMEGKINVIITPIGSTTAITMPIVITTPNGECAFNFSIPAGCTYKIAPLFGTLDVVAWYEFR